jgi:hypothetical protein
MQLTENAETVHCGRSVPLNPTTQVPLYLEQDQVGGGSGEVTPRNTKRRRNSSPVLLTPTRLRTVIHTTPNDVGVISAAQDRRSKLTSNPPDVDGTSAVQDRHSKVATSASHDVGVTSAVQDRCSKLVAYEPSSSPPSEDRREPPSSPPSVSSLCEGQTPRLVPRYRDLPNPLVSFDLIVTVAPPLAHRGAPPKPTSGPRGAPSELPGSAVGPPVPRGFSGTLVEPPPVPRVAPRKLSGTSADPAVGQILK